MSQASKKEVAELRRKVEQNQLWLCIVHLTDVINSA